MGFFLKVGVDREPILDVTHAYYYQVQAQLKFCGATCNYCDFVVWREGELFVQRIYPDDTFMASASRNMSSLSRWLYILPEILGKWYSKEPIKKPKSINPNVEENDKDQAGNTDQTVLLWCYCRKESGQMIACDNATFNGFTRIASTSQKFQRENGFVLIAVNRKRRTHIHNNYNIIISKFYSNETTESQQLHNAQQIVTTLSITLMSSGGGGVHIIK